MKVKALFWLNKIDENAFMLNSFNFEKSSFRKGKRKGI